MSNNHDDSIAKLKNTLGKTKWEDGNGICTPLTRDGVALPTDCRAQS
jgi:hypothetical protein